MEFTLKNGTKLSAIIFGYRVIYEDIISSTKKRRNRKMARMLSPGKCHYCLGTFHLLVEGRYLPEYWMHLLVTADISLKKLDTFLRDIWLECCGHLSAYTIEDKTYSIMPMRELREKSMKVKLNEVLSPGMKFYHDYDFGTTTHLTLKVISELELNAKGRFIRIMARNNPPERNCEVCGNLLLKFVLIVFGKVKDGFVTNVLLNISVEMICCYR